MPNDRSFRRAALGWFRTHARSFPWRETRDPYAVMIAEVLLQRTRGENAVAVFETFLRKWPTPTSLAQARTASLASVIRPLGLGKRALALKKLGRAVTQLGEVPTQPERLLALPGIGPYAAHSIPVFSIDADLPVVDWVIARLLRRYFGLPYRKRPNADQDLWALASRLAKKGRARELWLGSLDLAAAVCKPRPLCPQCPLRRDCAFYNSPADGMSEPPIRMTTV